MLINRFFTSSLFCATALAAASLAPGAHADTWVNPTNVRASSWHNSSLMPQNAINGSGLTPDLLDHSNSASNTMWDTLFAPGNWAGWYEVDLGQTYDLSRMDLYNFNDKWSDMDQTDRGVKDFQILISNDGVNYAPLGGMQIADKAVGHYLHEGTIVKTAPCTPQSFALNTNARFVKLRIDDNWGYRHTINGVVGLSELRFYGNATGTEANVSHNDFTVTASSTSSGNTTLLVDGTGLDPNGYGSHDWHHGGGAGDTGWAGTKDAQGQVTLNFDFDAPTDLASIQIWNLNMWFGGGEAAKDFRLLIKQQGDTEFSTIIDDELRKPNGEAERSYDYSELFAINLTDVIAAQLIIDSTDYEYSTTAALSELRFIQAVPEPTPLTLLTIACLSMIRRNNNHTA